LSGLLWRTCCAGRGGRGCGARMGDSFFRGGGAVPADGGEGAGGVLIFCPGDIWSLIFVDGKV
jgi:hypothetical protein